MCGISGFCCFDTDFNKNYNKWHNVLVDMRESLAHRGKDETGEYLKKNIGLSHTRLSIRDLYNGNQPMIKTINNVEYAIVYNGEIYDTEALKAELEKKGYVFDGTSDTEIILYSFIEYGKKCVEKLNGIFAFCIWHSGENKLYLFRDRSGVKPLFYTIENNTLIFASEIKALFCHPYVTPEININSFREIFGIGPARTEGFGVFKNIYEIKYGHYGEFSINGFTEKAYWKLSTLKTNHNYEETVQNVNQLITSAVEYQMVSDVPVCSFLSGGVDSCIVTALASNYLQKQGKTLNTFSFDFTDNNKYFKSNSFQPEQDRPYVDIMLKEYNLNHTYLECSNEELADMLYCSVDAKDLPGMADVDASMLYFCKLVKEHNKVALTGECADEIFGGYPWFYREDLMNSDTFPWSIDTQPRLELLDNDFIDNLNINEYIKARYKDSLSEMPEIDYKDETERRRYEITFLNLKWFMTTLLDRMDRASMYSGLEARVPYADHRIIEYLWNFPWEYKNHNGIVKGLLRDSMKGLLPEKILFRKKSPYPKTYNPIYEKILKERVLEIISNNNSPIMPIIDKTKIVKFICGESNYGKPWFGQLMAGPQMLAYIIQVNYWLKKFNLTI